MAKTLYVYDKPTGIISYTINDPTPQQLSNLNGRSIYGHLDSPGHSIMGTYVTVNAITQQTEGVAKIKEMKDYIICSDNKIVANGNHTVVVSNLHVGTAVTIRDRNGDFNFFPTEGDNTIELTANQISITPDDNKIQFTINEYGYKPKRYYIPLVKEEV